MVPYKCCKLCGEKFYKKVNCSKKRWTRSKFCSKSCADESFLKAPRLIVCKGCGKKFKRNTKDGLTKTKFCSLKCKSKFYSGKNHPNYNPKRHSNETILCGCGCGIKIPKYDDRGRKKKYVVGHTQRGKPRPDVSKKLKRMWKSGKLKPRTGKTHWNWKGGITGKLKLLRHSKKYKKWRLFVYKRDHFNCQHCGKHCNQYHIVAHHIKSFKKYPKLRFDINNGITLCRKCHLALHRGLWSLV